MKIKITDENFEEEVIKASMPVLVDFWAEWCGPCRAMAPIVQELAQEFDASKIKIGEFNVDESPKSAQDLGIMSIPTFIFFKDGKEIDRISGSMTKEALKNKITSHVA